MSYRILLYATIYDDLKDILRSHGWSHNVLYVESRQKDICCFRAI